MEKKWTPGPWDIETTNLSEGPTIAIYDSNGYIVCDHVRSTQFARMISLSPEMAEALARAEKELGCTCGNADFSHSPGKIAPAEHCEGCVARAIIAKVKGAS